MKLHFRDTNPQVIDELRKTMGNLAEYLCGDIFAFPVSAVISPANSFGYMDGGIDAVYVRRMGQIVEDRTKEAIAREPFGELLIGRALVVATDSALAPSMIVAPTMRVPRPTTAENVFLAARAAFSIALRGDFDTVACPGLGTLSGRVHPRDAANAILQGYDAAVREEKA